MRRKPMTREVAERHHKAGFGQGQGAAYKPWIQVHTFPSKGVSRRQIGRLTGRQHVLLSNLERAAFLAAQRLSSVVDIREQFPLLSLEETECIAQELRVRHPGPTASEPTVMTTNLLLTLRGGRLSAISVKQSRDLGERRTLEKLEIERRYWSSRNVDWRIVTEREISEDLQYNLVYLDECYDPPSGTDAVGVDVLEAFFLDAIRRSPASALNSVCLGVDAAFNLKGGTSLAITRHALAHKRWLVPLAIRLDPSKPLMNLEAGPFAASSASDQGLKFITPLDDCVRGSGKQPSGPVQGEVGL